MMTARQQRRILCFAMSAAARAAEPATTAPSVGELEALVATIEDPTAREKLVAQLKALIAAQHQTQPTESLEEIGTGVVAGLSRRLAAASQSVADAAEALRDAPQVSRWLQRQIDDPKAIERWKAVAIYVVLTLAAGFIAQGIARVITDERMVEDRLNEEVREILSQHTSQMERSDITYSDMFKKTKRELAKKKGIVL